MAGGEKSRPVTVAPRRPTTGVETEVALQMHERATLDRAKLVGLERSEGVAPGEEALHVVEVALDVDPHALIPARPVRLAPWHVGDVGTAAS